MAHQTGNRLLSSSTWIGRHVPPAPPAPSAAIQKDLPVLRIAHAEPKVIIEFLTSVWEGGVLVTK